MMLSCRQATELLSEKLDRKLTLKEKAELKLHVMLCSGCRNFSGNMLELRSISRGFAKGEKK